MNYQNISKVANLLYLENESHGHYAGIKNINRLIGKQGMHKRFLCYNCMSMLASKEKLDNHLSDCRRNKFQKVVFPSAEPYETPTLKFKNYKKTLKQGFCCYLDFESLLKKTEYHTKDRTKIENSFSDVDPYTVTTQIHKPAEFCYVIVNVHGKIHKQRQYRGSDCIDVFFESIIKDADEIVKIYENEKLPLKLTPLEEELFKKSKRCFICKEYFLLDDLKVRHHDHLKGNKYIIIK